MKLRGGEEIIITGAVELPPLRAFAEDIPLDVLFEDESIAVINKPAGMSVHAGSGKDEAGNRGNACAKRESNAVRAIDIDPHIRRRGRIVGRRAKGFSNPRPRDQ